MQSKSAIAVEAKRVSELTVHIGEDVWALLLNNSFLTDWDELYETCPWATVFQSRAFVITWYQTYRDKYTPIVVKSVHNNKLKGLLTLAIPSSDNQKGSIMGAGQFESYYHVWLTEASNGESFIKAAMQKILQQFPHANIHLRYVTLQAPLQWLKESYWKSRSVIQSYNRPLMDMSHSDFSKMFHKTEFRNKLNRHKRLGELTFEHITNKEQFSAILEELVIQYDFRQGAMFNYNQFKEEPLKANFLLALFETNLLHVTVLKVNKQFFASIVAIAGHDWVHLAGINVHTPFHARFYSSGFVHFILLGQQLAKDGFTVFDLTPGGDSYKERMATRHDEVLEVVISSNFKYRTKRLLRKHFYKSLTKIGKWPLGVELSLRKRLYILKGRIRRARKEGLLNTILEKAKNLAQRPVDKIYISTTTFQASNANLPINKNSLSDLLQYEAEGTWMTRWEFLEDAMNRFGVGQIAYTFCEKDRLLACVWMSNEPGIVQSEALTQNNIPEGATFLHGFYCHPEGQSRFNTFLLIVAAAVMKDCKEGKLYALTTSNDKKLYPILKALGFENA